MSITHQKEQYTKQSQAEQKFCSDYFKNPVQQKETVALLCTQVISFNSK